MLFEQGHALVIGVGTYAKTPRLNVPITAKDASLVAELLRDPTRCAYPEGQVTLLHDETATRERLLAELDRLAETGEDSTVVVFYSGHGEYGEDGTYYLTTHDTEMASRKVVADTGVREQELLDRLKRIKARRALLLFNSCHSGEISPPVLGGEPEMVALGEAVPQNLAVALLGTGQGRVIITACGEGQKSYFERTADTTIFAQALADGLAGKEIANRRGFISVFDLYEYLFDTVSTRVKQAWDLAQEPELTISKGVGRMAVALHNGPVGPAVLGGDDDEEPDAPRAGRGVREVDAGESQRVLDALLAGELKRGVTQTATNAASGITGNVTQESTVVSTDQRKGIFGGTFTDSMAVGVNEGTLNVTHRTNSDDITVGNITGSIGVAIGRGASATVTTGLSGLEAANLFASIYRQIEARRADPNVEKDEIAETVRKIEQEAGVAQPNETKLGRWLSGLAGMAPDIFDVTVAALSNPAGAFDVVVRKVAERAKAERGG